MQTAATAQPAPVSPARPRFDSRVQPWTLALAAIASLMVALDAMIVSTALAEIGREFGASFEALEWTVNAYTLTFAVAMMTASVLGDRFGRRRLFACGLAIFTAASALCALAPSIGWLIAARALQGVGAATIMPLALAQISAVFPPERRGWALGIYSSVTALSAVAGPIVGGAVTHGLAWPFVFWLNLPIGIAALAFSLSRLEESFGPKAAIDLGGLALMTTGVLGLVWGLVRANQAGWESLEVMGALGLGALAVLLFIGWEVRHRAPMIPMRLFRNGRFTAGNASMFLLNGALMAALFFMAQFQQRALGEDALTAGLRLLPWGIAVVLAAPKASAFANRLGDPAAVLAGLLAQAVGLVWLGLIADPALVYAKMIPPMVLAGAGFAIAVPTVQKAVVGAVAMADIGKASGALSMIRQLGGAFGVAIAVAAFADAGGGETAHAFSRGFMAAMIAAGLMSLAAALAGLGLKRR